MQAELIYPDGTKYMLDFPQKENSLLLGAWLQAHANSWSLMNGPAYPIPVEFRLRITR